MIDHSQEFEEAKKILEEVLRAINNYKNKFNLTDDVILNEEQLLIIDSYTNVHTSISRLLKTLQKEDIKDVNIN